MLESDWLFFAEKYCPWNLLRHLEAKMPFAKPERRHLDPPKHEFVLSNILGQRDLTLHTYCADPAPFSEA